MIIGIDNALTGGICLISREHGKLIAMRPMPIKKRHYIFEKTKKRKRFGLVSSVTAPFVEDEIDGLELVEWIKFHTDSRPCSIVIEECPEHARQKSIMRSMAKSYGIIVGAIEAALLSYSLTPVRSGNPLDSWQRAMLGKCEKGETKLEALAVARQLWPDENWFVSDRSKVPNSGLIDAALIAEYGRRQNL